MVCTQLRQTKLNVNHMSTLFRTSYELLTFRIKLDINQFF